MEPARRSVIFIVADMKTQIHDQGLQSRNYRLAVRRLVIQTVSCAGEVGWLLFGCTLHKHNVESVGSYAKTDGGGDGDGRRAEKMRRRMLIAAATKFFVFVPRSSYKLGTWPYNGLELNQ